jgi:hypothetical protein
MVYCWAGSESVKTGRHSAGSFDFPPLVQNSVLCFLLPLSNALRGQPHGLDICYPWVHNVRVSEMNENLPDPQATNLIETSSNFWYTKKESF